MGLTADASVYEGFRYIPPESSSTTASIGPVRIPMLPKAQ